MRNRTFQSRLIVGLGAALVLLPISALARVTGYEVVTQETAVDTSPDKQLIIDCPAGKYAVGAGWAAVDKTGSFLDGQVLASLPSWDGSGWTFNVRNMSYYQPAWKLRARIICADVSTSWRS